MPQRIRTQPRKSPSQARSLATVEAILGATARVLTKQGYDRASTNRIAEVAGVSVGSLYQYFPSKEALVAALIDRHSDEMVESFLAAMAGVAEEPLASGVRRVIEAMVDAHLVEPELHRIFAEQVPRVGRLGRLLEDLDTYAIVAVRAYLESRRAELAVEDLDVATFIVVHAVEALVHRSIGKARAVPRDVLVEALVDLVVCFLASKQRAASLADGAAFTEPT